MKGRFTIKPCKHGLAAYQVVGRVNGKRIRNFFRTKAEAEVHCERRNTELLNYGQTMADMPSFLRAEALACSERLAKIGATLTKATDYFLQVYDFRAKSVTVQYAWEQCKADLARRLAGNEISEAYVGTVKKAANKLIAAFGPQQICDLDSQTIEQWLYGLPIGTTTKENVRKHLGCIFTYAAKRGWIEQTPMAKIKAFALHRLQARPPGILTPEEAAALLYHAEPEIVPFFAIGLFAGLRVAELQRLDWSEIKWDKRLIYVVALKSKTAQIRRIPMTDNLVAWLTPHRQAHGPVTPQLGRSARLKRAREAAGIKNWGNGKANALRHSYCSYHLALHEDAGVTTARAGHKSATMIYKHYNNPVEKSEAERYFSIAPAEAQNIVAIAL